MKREDAIAIIKCHEAELKELGVLSLALFGSTARDEASADSDVDVAVTLKPGTRYPATMVTTADHDDRVVPAHSFKFAARLQECQAKDGPPVIIRIETSAGHGAGTALNKVIEQSADQLGFLMKVFGM